MNNKKINFNLILRMQDQVFYHFAQNLKNHLHLFILLLIIFQPGMGTSQTVTSDFEEGCSQSSYSFELGCIPHWTAAYGTPDNNLAGELTPAYTGLRRAHCYARLRQDLQPQFRGEGIILNYNFEVGKTYKIRYAWRATHGPLQSLQSLEMKWILTNNFVSSAPSDAVPSIPSDNQVILVRNGYSQNYRVEEFCFTPNSNYSQLLLRNVMTSNVFITDRNSDVYIDDFSLTNVTPEYEFTDEFGTPKSRFCFGEDVYIKLANPSITRIYVDAWLDPNYNSDWYTGPGWIDIQNGFVNLSEALRLTNHRAFEPENRFYIKLATNVAGCNGWVESREFFDYHCCNNINYAGFSSNISGSDVPFTITANADKDYTPYGGIHEFCLYTDSDNDGIYEIVTCQNSPVFNFTLYEPQVTYYLVHRVSTPCGDYCSAITFSVLVSGRNESLIVDCNQFPRTCPTPKAYCPVVKNPFNNQFGFGFVFDTPIPGNFNDIQIIKNDPSCCRQMDGPRRTYNYSVEGNFFNLNEGLFGSGCYSYRVRTRCENGSVSAWSPKICYPSCKDDPKTLDPRTSSYIALNSDVNIIPNPVNERIQFVLNLSEGDEFLNVTILDLVGNKIIETNSFVESGENSIDLSFINSGVYFAVVKFLKSPSKTIKFIKIN